MTYTTSKLAEKQLITLVKQNGKWLVQLDKAQQYEDEEPIMTESLDAIQDSAAAAKQLVDSVAADTTKR